MAEGNDSYSERKRRLRDVIESLPYEQQENLVATFINFSGMAVDLHKKLDALFAEISEDGGSGHISIAEVENKVKMLRR